MKKNLIIFIVAFVIGFIIVFALTTLNNDSSIETSEETIQVSENEKPTQAISPVILNTELKNILTNTNFKILDFSDKPVLLESFAVWCPTCTRQQQEIQKLHDEILGDSFVSISLDTDPNEDESKVLEHLQRNGFDWRYVISPVEFTRALIDEFGVGIVNAPSAPVILICNGEARKLDSGLKSANELKGEIESCNA